MDQPINFDLDDTARRIGHLVLRIWQLEEENKRALSLAGLRGQASGDASRQPGEGVAASAVQEPVGYDESANGAGGGLESLIGDRSGSPGSLREGLK